MFSGVIATDIRTVLGILVYTLIWYDIIYAGRVQRERNESCLIVCISFFQNLILSEASSNMVKDKKR